MRIRDKIKKPRRPVVAYEILPPREKDGTLNSYAETISSLLSQTHIDAINIPEVHDEAGRGDRPVANHKRAIKFNTNDISWEQAASIQGNLQTMHDAIVTNGNFVAGQTVFIQGASSGVGIIGLQIAKALGASKILGSSTNQNKLSKLSNYGADVLIDTSKEDWLDSVMNATDGKGVDVLVDMLSGNFVNKNMEATKINGYLINI